MHVAFVGVPSCPGACYAHKSSNPFDNPVVFREAAAPVYGESAMARNSRNLHWTMSNARPPIISMKPEFPVCSICNRHVVLETAKVDEYGRAMHGECYLLKLQLERTNTPRA